MNDNVQKADFVPKRSRKFSQRLSQTGERISESAKEVASRAKTASSHGSEQVAGKVPELKSQGNQFLRENPGIALVGAVGIGVLIGLALNNKS